MNDPTKLQQECLNRLKNWPRRKYINRQGDKLEYNGVSIEQAVGKNQYNDDITVYKITMDGVLVPNNMDIDLMCAAIFRRCLKIDVVKREKAKEILLAGGWYLGIVGLFTALFVFGFKKCGGYCPPDVYEYDISQNNRTDIKPMDVRLAHNKLAQWDDLYGRARIANYNNAPPKTR
ncbi:MAG: hypothetical protein J5620_02740 [Alphaproteobacteria bacterium]|nr:hypothetical protein [Alphaproteobacteria bacterium]